MASRFGISGDVEEPSRLDLILTRTPFALSRREAKRRLSAGDVVVDGHPVSVASRAIVRGAHVSLLAPEAPVSILHVDPECVVVDKPDAVPSQPSPGNSNPSLLEILASQLKRRGEKPELFIVHRLDTNTTGAIVLARTRPTADSISREIAATAEKRYVAICEGVVTAHLDINQPIARLSGNQFGVASTGKQARSLVDPIASSDEATLLEVTIKTGRTHQIRVHLAHIGHPIIGDRRYGSVTTGHLTARPMLHARSLDLPGRGRFEAPLPDDFQEACARFGLDSSNL